MTIRRLPLHERHASQGAKFGCFGEWEVPLYYRSILEEHHAVRGRAGLFDISHMGEFFVRGHSAENFLEELLPRRIAELSPGQARYQPLLSHEGGILDDLLVYRWGPQEFLLIVNAGTIEKDFNWIRSQTPSHLTLEDRSESLGLLALQGPQSPLVVDEVFGAAYTKLAYYHFQPFQSGMVARTGYTGEDGFEILLDLKELGIFWDRILEVGQRRGIAPVGFGARDTLRLEAGMLLYGHDMSEEINPFEAGLDWAVCLDKENFIGKETLMRRQKEGIRRHLIGFEMTGRGIPRQGCEIRKGGRVLGEVTSGSFSPTLQKNIGLGYVAIEESRLGNEIEVMIRDKTVPARIVRLPFYKRKRQALSGKR